jgi:CRISPR/Cas system-associated exonuclease Cas4 (RecB family)
MIFFPRMVALFIIYINTSSCFFRSSFVIDEYLYCSLSLLFFVTHIQQRKKGMFFNEKRKKARKKVHIV